MLLYKQMRFILVYDSGGARSRGVFVTFA
jgi:hypothetical protein